MKIFKTNRYKKTSSYPSSLTTTSRFIKVVFLDTSVSEIEETFKTFTNRGDIAIILINQVVSNGTQSYVNVKARGQRQSIYSKEVGVWPELELFCGVVQCPEKRIPFEIER